MPRNGLGVASKPAGTTAVANTVIESSKYNQTVDDIYQLLNDALPITAGGTGATSAAGARTSLGVDPSRTFVTKSANYTALAADKAANIRFDGVYTLSLTAAATLGSGWYCYVQADGGAVTIDPNASETINGAATLVIADSLSTTIWCDGSNFQALTSAPSGELYRGLITGLTLSNNVTDPANDINIAPGLAGSDGTTPVLMTLASTLTKRLDAAWAVGSGNGGLDTGSKANGTGYHVWLIQRSDTGVVDVLFSLSGSAPTMPVNYDRKVKVGCVVTDGSGVIRPFTQSGNRFTLTSSFVVAAAINQVITNTTLPLPTGVVYDAEISGSVTGTASWGFLVYTPGGAPDIQDLVARGGAGAVSSIGVVRIPTNTSSQITTAGTSVGMSITLVLRGWTYPRGS